MYRLPIFTGWCSTPNQLLICSSGVHRPEKHHGFWGGKPFFWLKGEKMTRIDLDKTRESESQALPVSSQNSPSCDFLRFLFQPSWSNLWKKTANKNPLLFTKNLLTTGWVHWQTFQASLLLPLLVASPMKIQKQQRQGWGVVKQKTQWTKFLQAFFESQMENPCESPYC